MKKNLTIVAATLPEIEPLLDYFRKEAIQYSPSHYQLAGYDIRILISGIGILESTYHLMDHLMLSRPDLWIQMGIGGAVDSSLGLGEVYIIESEILFDFGAQEKDGRIMNQFEMGWKKQNDFPYQNEILLCPNIPTTSIAAIATGMTTLYSHGYSEKIDKIHETMHGQIENMEGAAFFYVSLMKKIPFLSVRGISNFVEPRNTASWNIPLAVNNLNGKMIEMLNDDYFLKSLLD